MPRTGQDDGQITGTKQKKVNVCSTFSVQPQLHWLNLNRYAVAFPLLIFQTVSSTFLRKLPHTLFQAVCRFYMLTASSLRRLLALFRQTGYFSLYTLFFSLILLRIKRQRYPSTSRTSLWSVCHYFPQCSVWFVKQYHRHPTAFNPKPSHYTFLT